jgi:hypothetical protein
MDARLNMEPWLNDTDRAKPKHLDKQLSQCPGIDSGLRHGTATAGKWVQSGLMSQDVRRALLTPQSDTARINKLCNCTVCKHDKSVLNAVYSAVGDSKFLQKLLYTSTKPHGIPFQKITICQRHVGSCVADFPKPTHTLVTSRLHAPVTHCAHNYGHKGSVMA